MNKFEDFLKEGKKIQIKRKYTENHPARTVGKTANVRNEILKAVKDGVITEEEFTKILSKLSGDHKQWRTRNTKYFNVSEEGIKLSKWGRRILSEVEEAPKLKSFPVHEATVVMDAIDPKSKTLKKLLKKYNVKMKVLTMNGPGGGHPEVEMTGSREDLQAVLADPNGWDDPELGEYIEEKIEEKIKITKDDWPIIKFKDGGKKYEVEFDDYDVIDDHGNEGKDVYFMGTDQDGKEWTIDASVGYNFDNSGNIDDIHYDTLTKVDESTVTEAKESAWDKLNRIADEEYGEFGFATLGEDDMADHIDMKKADKLADKEYGEFGFTSLGEDDMKELINNNPKLVKESVVNEKDDAGDHLDKLAELVGKARDFFAIGKELKAGKYKYDYSDSMMPMYTIKADGFKFAILNKRYVDSGDREVGEIAIGLMENIKTEITNMETFSIHESFASFTGANGFLNEAIGSQLLASVLMSNQEGKYGKQNLKQLAGGFYQLAKVALDKIGDEDMIISNDPTKVFKEHGGSKHILFFISDTEKDNPYCPYDAGYGSLQTVPGGGLLIAAMSGDREFYTNDWSRYSQDRSFKKDGKKGKDDQVGVSHKYRGWSGTGLNNGKRIAEVSDRVLVINLDLIRQKYSTEQLRAARKEAKAGAIAFTNDKDFKKANNDRYHQILSTKAAKMPLDKMVADAIDMLTDQIKEGLAKGEKTRYEEIKIGESAKGKEVKLRDASNHMSNILDDYSRYCDYVRQEEESEKRFGSSESWYKREIKNYALSIKERIAKIEGFDYAW